MSKPTNPDHFTMSFGDHLEDLRKRLVFAMIVPIPLALLLYFFSDKLIVLLYRPLDQVLLAEKLPRTLQVLGPAEALLTQIKLSLIAAIVMSAPWILWQAWLFISPGLYSRERRFVHFLIPMSAVLTAAGIALMYFVMLPLMLLVLVSIGTSMQLQSVDADLAAALNAQPRIRMAVELPAEATPGEAYLLVPEMKLHVAVASEDTTSGAQWRYAPPRESFLANEFRLSTYISFVLMLLVGITIAFQMPLVIVLLGWLGLVETSWLHKRKYALFVWAVVAAAITPADPWSMLMMLVPLYVLYEFGILLLMLFPAQAVAAGRFEFRKSDKAVPRSPGSTQTALPSDEPSPAPPSEDSEASPADEEGAE